MFLFLGGACSSDSDGGGDDFDNALQAYESAVTTEAQAYAEAASTEHLAALSQVGETGTHQNPTQAVLAVMKTLEGRASSSGQAICAQVGPLKEKAGDDTARLTTIKQVSDSILIDSLASALLGKVLADSPEKRDATLDLLGVQATSPTNEPLHGLMALQVVSLVDSSGKIVIPGRGTDAHGEYVSWLRHQATGLQSTIDGLTAKVRERIDGCLS
jgi:hypothetical protein